MYILFCYCFLLFLLICQKEKRIMNISTACLNHHLHWQDLNNKLLLERLSKPKICLDLILNIVFILIFLLIWQAFSATSYSGNCRNCTGKTGTAVQNKVTMKQKQTKIVFYTQIILDARIFWASFANGTKPFRES